MSENKTHYFINCHFLDYIYINFKKGDNIFKEDGGLYHFKKYFVTELQFIKIIFIEKGRFQILFIEH